MENNLSLPREVDEECSRLSPEDMKTFLTNLEKLGMTKGAEACLSAVEESWHQHSLHRSTDGEALAARQVVAQYAKEDAEDLSKSLPGT